MNEYQSRARQTALYADSIEGIPKEQSQKLFQILYCSLGLSGEAGEVAELSKKLLRDGGGFVDAERKLKYVKEIGDVLWYLACLCYELDLTLDDAALKNIAKLADRKKRGIIQGEGSDR